MDFLVFSRADNLRVKLFQQALAHLGMPSAKVCSYHDILDGKIPPVGDNVMIRLESPGRDFELERRLIRLGGGPDVSLEILSRGALRHPHCWFQGLTSLMVKVGKLFPKHAFLQKPADILQMFHKPRCGQLLARHGIPVPPSLESFSSVDKLDAVLDRHNLQGAYLKLFCGSSASGIIAYDRRGFAFSTMQPGGDGYYNSRRVHRYAGREAINEMIGYLRREGLHAEGWIPKIRLGGQPSDLRVVVINGEPSHCVVRVGKSTFTNLILGGRREPLERLAALTDLDPIMETCRKVGRVFGDSLYMGVDILVDREGSRHYVAEVNAFGDLLPDLLHHGEDTYTAEIRALWKNRSGICPL